MSDHPDFQELLRRARSGDEQACRELVDACLPRVLCKAKKTMRAPLRRLFDPEDFAQDVFMRLFRDAIHTHPFADEEHFIRFLVVCVHNEAAARNRRYLHKGKRDLRRDKPLRREPIDGHESNPLAGLLADEEWQCKLKELSPRQTQVVNLLGDGYTLEEIASALSLSEKTIHRLLWRVTRPLPN